MPYCTVPFRYAMLLVAVMAASFSPAPVQAQLHYNQETIRGLDRELSRSGSDARYRAVVKGLRWCVDFCDDDGNFNSTFSNYITMLDELTLHHPSARLETLVHKLILREFERARPRFSRLFAANSAGYEEFVSILPIAYHHRVPVKPLQRFAARQFSKVTPPDRMAEFRQSARELDYDNLTDLVVEAAFVDMAYAWGAQRDFRLPPNNYQAIMAQCADIPLVNRYSDEGYFDQNYYATHLLLALNHYGQKGLSSTTTGDLVFFYLAQQYDTVRHKVGDLDLLCEYLYCFRQFAPAGITFISEGERYVMSLQRPDGAWGTFAPDDTPYDRLHPTWTAITLLMQRER